MTDHDDLTFADLEEPDPAGDRYRTIGIIVGVATLLAFVGAALIRYGAGFVGG